MSLTSSLQLIYVGILVSRKVSASFSLPSIGSVIQVENLYAEENDLSLTRFELNGRTRIQFVSLRILAVIANPARVSMQFIPSLRMEHPRVPRSPMQLVGNVEADCLLDQHRLQSRLYRRVDNQGHLQASKVSSSKAPRRFRGAKHIDPNPPNMVDKPSET